MGSNVTTVCPTSFEIHSPNDVAQTYPGPNDSSASPDNDQNEAGDASHAMTARLIDELKLSIAHIEVVSLTVGESPLIEKLQEDIRRLARILQTYRQLEDQPVIFLSLFQVA
jgi:hypothetical protein